MSSPTTLVADTAPQELRFCRAPDGARIAYAVHGTGPPLVIAACWLSHLQFDWQSPVWRHFLADLGQVATVIRYDERGHGLLDWDVGDFSLDARVGDLEAVVDDAGFDRFALMAMSQGGPVSIVYTVRHHERVSRLIFYSSYAAASRDPKPEDLAMAEAYDQLTRRACRRSPPGRGPHDRRRHRRSDRGRDPRDRTAGCDALVEPRAGRPPRHLAHHRRRDLAGLRAQTVA